MLTAYVLEGGGLRPVAGLPEEGVPSAAVWFDLFEPQGDEVEWVQQACGILLPTREEMQEIEASSRLYVEDGVAYMTAVVLSQSETEHPVLAAVTFILAGTRLITVRYSDPKPFKVFAARVLRTPYRSAEAVLAGLLETVVDRAADILERVGADVDALSGRVFAHSSVRPGETRDFESILQQIGRTGELTSRARESLMAIGRLLAFLGAAQGAGTGGGKATKELRQSVKVMWRDVQSLLDHANFLSGKITFLLDATLGMINIEQSATIKIFSVVAVIFLPPTLVASIYGMNFRFMPELDWPFGYPLALLLMLVSALIPYLYFKRKHWL